MSIKEINMPASTYDNIKGKDLPPFLLGKAKESSNRLFRITVQPQEEVVNKLKAKVKGKPHLPFLDGDYWDDPKDEVTDLAQNHDNYLYNDATDE